MIHHKTIAVITSDLEYFNASICSGLNSEFSKNEYNTSIHLTYENENNEKEYVLKCLDNPHIAGLVIFSCMGNASFYQEILKTIKKPCVFVDRVIPYLSECNFVSSDNYGGSKKISELLAKKGAKNIVCLSMLKDKNISTTEDRINGFRDGHALFSDVNCFRKEVEYSDTITGIKSILEEWENIHPPPDAIFAMNHLIMNAIIQLTQQNQKWREMLQKTLFSCFDNLPYFDWLEKPIISVEQPIHQIVYYTAHILIKRINDEKSFSHYSNIILPVKIIDRTVSR